MPPSPLGRRLLARHPQPPGDLNRQELPIEEISTGAVWYRLHPKVYDTAPLNFGGSGEGRFDAPSAEYRVLYAGSDGQCAFVETLGRNLQHRTVSTAALATLCLTHVEILRPLKLVRLVGAGLHQLGADARLTSTARYGLTQKWALALWRHPQRPHGLFWRSRFDNDRYAIALFDHAAPALAATCTGTLLEPHHTALLDDCLERYRVAWL